MCELTCACLRVPQVLIDFLYLKFMDSCSHFLWLLKGRCERNLLIDAAVVKLMLLEAGWIRVLIFHNYVM